MFKEFNKIINGLSVSISSNIRIESNNATGISIFNSDNILMENNNIFGSIGLFMTSESQVRKNNVYSIYNGIEVRFESKNNIIAYNLIYNGEDGLFVDQAVPNQFLHNRLFNCTIEFYTTSGDNSFNAIFTNNTIDGKNIIFHVNENNKIIEDDSSPEIILVNCSEIIINGNKFSKLYKLISIDSNNLHITNNYFNGLFKGKKTIITLKNTTKTTLRDNQIINTVIRLFRSDNNNFINNTMNESGLDFFGDSNVIINNYFEKSHDDGIYLRQKFGEFCNNSIKNAEKNCLYLKSSENLVLKNNFFHNCKENGIVIEDSRFITLINNSIKENQENGIVIEDSRFITLINNSIKENQENGIVIEDSYNISINNNYINENGKYGILVEEVRIKLEIKNNTISNNKNYSINHVIQGKLVDYSTDNEFINNLPYPKQKGISFSIILMFPTLILIKIKKKQRLIKRLILKSSI